MSLEAFSAFRIGYYSSVDSKCIWYCPSWYVRAICFVCNPAFCRPNACNLLLFEPLVVPIQSARRLCGRELLDECSEFLSSFQRNRVVIAGSNAANASVAFESSETQVSRLLEECFFSFIDVASLIFAISRKTAIELRGLQLAFVTRKQMFILDRTDLSGTIW